ncbi:hypothetical protein C8N32_12428 [Rhodovulum imhoffii]|uniref:Uncharacterized protein n=1 Tax=Rhodovulum imhoffii TaxID=365340 RepID=A0A2T5BP00_9RHOB|nr:hypothetical protein [Rhodovulum imhoffii]MBK5933650.1 hypothetical protein [Rhodovulum imhoffii]PTN00734.1 hypothetical protein C8N32_12428 [Rhodovulum imhoffii]
MELMNESRVRDILREVRFPGASQGIVEEGLIGRIVTNWPRVELEILPSGRQGRALEDVETRIRGVLSEAGFADVRMNGINAGPDHGQIQQEGCGCETPRARRMTPLEAEYLEDGMVSMDELPEDELLATVLGRQDLAERAGYRPGGPDPLAGPRETLDYSSGISVLQWDIDPHDASQTTRQHEIRLGDWDYRIWWQVHPLGGLFYVSMQAMREDWIDHEGASPHPVGRSEAVNLVFDETRNAVIAVYGTVRDFRPFIKAFSVALETEADTQPTAEEPGK